MTNLITPGVYIREIASGVRTIAGVSTSTTAFIGAAPKGEANNPVQISSFGEYTSLFGGLNLKSPMSFAVQQYFQNGGQTALIVRVAAGDGLRARFTFAGTPAVAADPGPPVVAASPAKSLLLEASSPGAWGNNLVVTIDDDSSDPANLINITVSDPAPNGSGALEIVRNLAADATLTEVLKLRSQFLRTSSVTPVPGGGIVNKPTLAGPGPHTATVNFASAGSAFTAGADGTDIASGDLLDPANGLANKTGVFALENADIFNILCIPPPTFATTVSAATWAAAAAYCRSRRAFLIVDPPPGPYAAPVDKAKAGIPAGLAAPDTQFAGLFFPRFKAPNPLTKADQEFVPCGAVAGIFARTDASRGVWKAPAGIDAGISGITELSYLLNDAENGTLNSNGVNCLRSFSLFGNVSWGSRTLDGADARGSEWKYIPIRRLALFLEESLYRGTQWVVFEPNDEPLWAQIRLNVGSFLNNLFRQGAFQGVTPREAYFVKCDAETTTQNDRNLGIVNILVGFAPLKPAEFVVIKIQQIAGDIQV